MYEEFLEHLARSGSVVDQRSVCAHLGFLPQQRRPAVLSSFDLPGIAKFIKERPACKIIVLTGVWQTRRVLLQHTLRVALPARFRVLSAQSLR